MALQPDDSTNGNSKFFGLRTPTVVTKNNATYTIWSYSQTAEGMTKRCMCWEGGEWGELLT